MGKIILNGKVYGGGEADNVFAPVIYSDVERCIGVWRDNKPLYAKTLNPSVNVGSNTINHGIANLEKCVRIYGVCKYNNTSEQLPLPYVSTNTAYAIACGNVTSTTYLVDVGSGFGSIQECYLTFFYTKTTDVAGSSDYNTYGVPTVHYSTNEQVVGTYLGKPLYQRTYSGLSVSCTNQGTWYSTGQNYGDIESIISCVVVDQYGQNISGSAGYMSQTPKPIALNLPLNGRVIKEFTIQYTKTTD